jgi:hypothetical protein
MGLGAGGQGGWQVAWRARQQRSYDPLAVETASLEGSDAGCADYSQQQCGAE